MKQQLSFVVTTVISISYFLACGSLAGEAMGWDESAYCKDRLDMPFARLSIRRLAAAKPAVEQLPEVAAGTIDAVYAAREATRDRLQGAGVTTCNSVQLPDSAPLSLRFGSSLMTYWSASLLYQALS